MCVYIYIYTYGYSPFKSSLQCFKCFIPHKEVQTFRFGWGGGLRGFGLGVGGGGIRVRCGGVGGVRVVCMSAYGLELLNGLYQCIIHLHTYM